MNKEEIKDYLKKVDELGDKLTGEDKKTYAWLIYGYSQCAKLLNETEQQNKKQKNILDEIYNHCESRINVCKSLQSDDEWECCIAELDGVISILKEVE